MNPSRCPCARDRERNRHPSRDALVAAAFSAVLMLTSPGAAQDPCEGVMQTAQSAACGMLVDEEQRPLAGYPVEVRGAGEAEGRIVFTDKDGVWRVYNLPDGTYTVSPVPGALPDPENGSEGEMAVEFQIDRPSTIRRLFGARAPLVAADTLAIPQTAPEAVHRQEYYHKSE